MTSHAAIARLAVALGSLVALGCGDGVPAQHPCVQRWSVSDTHTNPELAVQVAGGALTIALPLAVDEAVFVGHDGALTGDFVATFDFEVFTPGDTAAYLHAAISLDDPNLIDVPFVGVGIGVDDGQTDVRALLVYHDEGRTRFDLALTQAVEGTLRIVRTGRMITLTATVPSGESATISGQVSDAPARIGLQFASGTDQKATGDASVRITDFRVEGGGGAVTTDHFDCDSLR